MTSWLLYLGCFVGGMLFALACVAAGALMVKRRMEHSMRETFALLDPVSVLDEGSPERVT